MERGEKGAHVLTDESNEIRATTTPRRAGASPMSSSEDIKVAVKWQGKQFVVSLAAVRSLARGLSASSRLLANPRR